MMLTEDDERLLAAVTDLEVEGVPDELTRQRRTDAAAEALGVLGPYLTAAGDATSPLGPGWSTDLDLYLRRPAPDGELLGRGWIPLDRLLAGLGSATTGRWAIVRDGRIVGAADLHLGEPAAPMDRILDRIRRLGHARVREVLELRALVRQGVALPPDPAAAMAARREAMLGGDVLARLMPAQVSPSSARTDRVRRAAGALRRRLRPKVVVALSGVDGSGKSTTATTLSNALEAAGVPTGRVWARPGMNIGWLDAFARLVKRVRGQSQAPGVRTVAKGATPASRTGAVGWVWALLVAVAFAVDVRRQHRRAAGVVIYDRHLADAITTLDFVYAGVDLRLQRAIVRRALPRADLTVYLRITADEAVARKPGDTFGEHAVREQLQRYDQWLAEHPPGLVIDATSTPEETAIRIVTELAG